MCSGRSNELDNSKEVSFGEVQTGPNSLNLQNVTRCIMLHYFAKLGQISGSFIGCKDRDRALVLEAELLQTLRHELRHQEPPGFHQLYVLFNIVFTVFEFSSQ